MTWALQVSAEFKRDYRKRCAKDAAFREAVNKKVAQILENPMHHRPLRQPLHGFRRVHVMGSFVIVFEPMEADQAVRLMRLAHHDEAYGI